MGIDVGPVEYATTADGVSIAYQAMGSGLAVLRLPTESVSLRYLSELPATQSVTQFEERFQVWSFDPPAGIGMSDRSARDFSLDAAVADAVAVAEAVGGPLPVLASQWQVPTALRLAAERPDLVSQLVLSRAGGADNAELSQTPLVRAATALLEADWDTFVQHVARVTVRLDGEAADHYVDQLEQETGEQAMREQLAEYYRHDASQWVTAVRVPTLVVEVVSGRPYQRTFAEGTRLLAQKIEGASLVRARDTAQAVEQVRQFLSHGRHDEVHGPFRTIMFTDLVSSTALTQQLGDDAAQQVVESHDTAVRAALQDHLGVEVKHTGDGIMAAFDSATGAARAANQIRAALTGQGVGVRIGLNAGEPIERHGDLFGTAVQLAARVGDAAAEGEVLATQVVRDLTAGKGLTWSPAPAIEAKGFDEPIQVSSLDV